MPPELAWCPWSPWSPPSATCGIGTYSRSREPCCEADSGLPVTDPRRCLGHLPLGPHTQAKADHVGTSCTGHDFSNWRDPGWIVLCSGVFVLLLVGLGVCRALTRYEHPPVVMATLTFRSEMTSRRGRPPSDDAEAFISNSDPPPSYEEIMRTPTRNAETRL